MRHYVRRRPMHRLQTVIAVLALAALALNGVGVPRRMPGVWAKVREAAREAGTWDCPPTPNVHQCPPIQNPNDNAARSGSAPYREPPRTPRTPREAGASRFRMSSDYLNHVRTLVRLCVPPGAELGMVTEEEGILSSTERSAHIAVAFERLPGRVDLAGAFGMLAYDALLLPWGSGRIHGVDLRAAGFEKKGETLAWELWARAAEPPAAATVLSRFARKSTGEAIGLAIVAGVALCGAWAAGWAGALLAVNGDYYGARQSGYVIRNGVLYRDSASDGEMLLIRADGSFEIVSASAASAEELLSDGAWQVLCFGPGLVEDGVIAVEKGEEVGHAKASNPRTAIGMLGEGHYLFLVSDGRTGESEGLSLSELAELMAAMGCREAYNLDGGGSSTMVFLGEVVNNPTTNGKRVSERSVSDIVYVG